MQTYVCTLGLHVSLPGCPPRFFPALFNTFFFTSFKSIHSCWILCKMKTVKMCKMLYTNIKWGKRNVFGLKNQGFEAKGTVSARKAVHTPRVREDLLVEFKEGRITEMLTPSSGSLTYGLCSFQTWLQNWEVKRFLKNIVTVCTSVNLTV